MSWLTRSKMTAIAKAVQAGSDDVDSPSAGRGPSRSRNGLPLSPLRDLPAPPVASTVVSTFVVQAVRLVGSASTMMVSEPEPEPEPELGQRRAPPPGFASSSATGAMAAVAPQPAEELRLARGPVTPARSDSLTPNAGIQ